MKPSTILTILLLPFAAQASINETINPSQLKLTYESFEGDWSYPCQAAFTQKDDPYDFTVKCFDHGVLKKTLDLHLAVTTYRKSEAPKTQIEILYWVNHEGATSWLYFDDVVTLKTFESSQSVVGEATALRMVLPLTGLHLQSK